MSFNPAVLASCRPPQDEELQHNFFRQAKWCPDGSVAMAQCENRSLQIVDPGSITGEQVNMELEMKNSFNLSAPILEFAWFPGASVHEPSSYCFVVSVRECPVQLLDASDGRLRASYKIVDHRERQIAPHCMAFNPMATHLYCGFEDAIEVFDIQAPGEGIRLPTTPSKKSKDGLKGILSSLSFCTDYSGLYAASSLSGNIALFDEATGEAVGYLEGVSKPVMQVQFNPAQPNILFASQRRSDDILFWDIRKSTHVLGSFSRKAANTNQKLKFDIELSGKWLVAGDEEGNLNFFDTTSAGDSAEPASSSLSLSKAEFLAHDDAVGSATFHPYDPTRLLSVSGSRHFHSFPIDDISRHSPSSSSASSGSDIESDLDEGEINALDSDKPVIRQHKSRHPFAKDASMKIWSIPDLFSNTSLEEPPPMGMGREVT